MANSRAYLDLTLELRDLDVEQSRFIVALTSSQVGEAEPVAVPYRYEDELEAPLYDLERKRLNSAELIELGQRLAGRLLPAGQSRALFLEAYKRAGREGGVRLRLLIREPKLAQLPWEYTYLKIHPGEDDLRHFLVLNPQISLVRHPPLAEAQPPLAPSEPGPLRMVAATANVRGYGQLELERERAVIEQAIAAIDKGEIELVGEAFLADTTLKALKRALQQKPALFHFAGHGAFEAVSRQRGTSPASAGGRGLVWGGAPSTEPRPGQGVIVLAADKKSRAPFHFPASQLAVELQKAGVRLAVLGACQSGRQDGLNVWTGVAPALIERGIPAVVAMQYEIIDEAAIAFNQMFYGALAHGLSVDEAVTEGRLALWQQARRDEAEWGVPVLYLRARDGVIFPERAADPTREPGRAKSRVRIVQQIETLYGQATAVEVEQMLQGQIEAQQQFKTVEAGGEVMGAKIDTLGGGEVEVKQASGPASERKIRIEIKQEVETQAGGQIIGAYFAAQEVKAPGPEVVAAYLERVVAGVGPLEEMGSIWQIPFQVRPVGRLDLPRQELDELVQKRFDATKSTRLIRRMVILAHAGVGKSASMLYLLLKNAERSLRNYHQYQPNVAGDKPAWPRVSAVVPLLLPLAELRGGLSLLALVRSAFNRYAPQEITLDEAGRLLEAYECLLLLDGLDELTAREHRGSIQTIRHFMDLYPHERYAISCRIAGYHGQLGPVEAFVLDDLTDEEAQLILGERYGRLSLPLRQLARNRSLLEIILSLEQTPDIPQSKGRLLQLLIRQRLYSEEVETTGEAPDPEMLEGLLERLAYTMQQERVYHYGERQVMAVIRAYLAEWHEPFTWRQTARVLRQLGLLVRDEQRQWRFSDRSTQAYFAAAAMRHEGTLLEPGLKQVSNDWWRETIEIFIGLVDDPSSLLFDLIDRDVLVAAHVLPFIGQLVDQVVADAMIDALLERIRLEQTAGRERIVRLLSEAGLPRIKEVFWELLQAEWRSLVILTIARPLWRLASAAAPRLLSEIEAQLAETEVMRRAEAVIDLWRVHSAASPAERTEIELRLANLMNEASTDKRNLVSGLAAIALGFIGTDQARAALLAKLVEPQADDFVAWCVAEGLTQINHPAVEQVAIELYTSPAYQDNRWRNHRARAVYLLGWVGRLPQTIDLLYQALTDPKPSIRGWAAHSLGRLEPQGSRRRLEQRLESNLENDPWVLRRLAEALGRVGSQDSIPILERYLRHEQFRTRQRFREAIANIRRRYELG